jgi:RHS repeat-associated protein
VTNELGEQYKIEVDLCGRVLKETGFDGRETGYRYDRAGRCSVMINAFNKRTTIERDPNGRIIKRVVPRRPWFGVPLPKGEEFTYTYDACGLLIEAKNATAAVSFKRDLRGDVIEERTGDHVIESRYDAVRKRIERGTNLGHTTQYDHDGNGNLLGVTFGVDPRWLDFAPESLSLGGPPVRAPWKAVIARNAAGAEMERRLPGGVVSRWERDHWGHTQVHRLLRKDVQVSAVGYQWRTDEQLAALVDTQAGSTRFTHDARSYLVAATRPDGTVQHRVPDAAGNIFRTRKCDDRAYSPGGRLAQNGGIRHVYNVEGQLIQKVMPDGTKWEHDWDWGGRLEAVTAPDGTKTTFAYDPLERRVRKTCGGRTTVYVWDGDELVHEVAEGEPLITWEFQPGTFAPVAKVEGQKRYSIVTDHLGAPQALLDGAGELVWKGELDLYGALRVEIALVACPWRWPGQYGDAETGLFYNRFRYYDPEAGRYISQDPIGLLGGFALYAYVNDPLTWIDPLGLNKCGVGKYRDVGGHHIHAKAGFKGHPLYVAGDALSISYEYMVRHSIVHERIFVAQRRLFKEMVALDLPNTMAEHTRIAVEALIYGGASRARARDLAARSLDDLLSRGIKNPTNIPWG